MTLSKDLVVTLTQTTKAYSNAMKIRLDCAQKFITAVRTILQNFTKVAETIQLNRSLYAHCANVTEEGQGLHIVQLLLQKTCS